MLLLCTPGVMAENGPPSAGPQLPLAPPTPSQGPQQQELPAVRLRDWFHHFCTVQIATMQQWMAMAASDGPLHFPAPVRPAVHVSQRPAASGGGAMPCVPLPSVVMPSNAAPAQSAQMGAAVNVVPVPGAQLAAAPAPSIPPAGPPMTPADATSGGAVRGAYLSQPDPCQPGSTPKYAPKPAPPTAPPVHGQHGEESAMGDFQGVINRGSGLQEELTPRLRNKRLTRARPPGVGMLDTRQGELDGLHQMPQLWPTLSQGRGNHSACSQL